MTIERIGTLMTQGQGVPSQAARGEHV
jgi:simple sugar transport system ATP-binding protein